MLRAGTSFARSCPVAPRAQSPAMSHPSCPGISRRAHREAARAAQCWQGSSAVNRRAHRHQTEVTLRGGSWHWQFGVRNSRVTPVTLEGKRALVDLRICFCGFVSLDGGWMVAARDYSEELEEHSSTSSSEDMMQSASDPLSSPEVQLSSAAQNLLSS